MRFEVLPGLPPYGPMALSFTERGEQEYREGLVVRFYPEKSDPWIGNFLGGETNCTVVLDHPNETDVIVVAKGNACVVDLEGQAIRHRIAGHDVIAVIRLPPLGLVLFQGSFDFIAIGTDGYRWMSPRISWDGFRNVEVQGTRLSGLAWTPIADNWVPFTLDLVTGHCADGIYEQDMARAIRVGP